MALKIVIQIGLICLLTYKVDGDLTGERIEHSSSKSKRSLRDLEGTPYHPCGTATKFTRYRLNNTNFEIEVAINQVVNGTFYDSFCCCRSKGMRLLSPTSSAELTALYQDLADNKIITSFKGFETTWSGFHNLYDVGTRNVYGQPSVVRAKRDHCLLLKKSDTYVSLVDTRCASRRPLWFMCRAFNDERMSRKVDKCFTNGKGCGEEAVQKLLYYRTCPREANTRCTCRKLWSITGACKCRTGK